MSATHLLNKTAGKRVTFVINSNSGGGVEQLAAILQRDLTAVGAKVETVYLYGTGGLKALAKLRSLAIGAWQIANIRSDIMITFQPTSSAVAMTIGRLAGCHARVVHQSNMPDSTHPVPRLLDRLAGSMGFYTVNIMNTAATERSFAQYPANYRSKSLRIEHGVNTAPPVRERHIVRSMIGVPDTAPMLLTCARVSSQKSIDTLIAALPEIEGAHFVLAGDGPKTEELKRQAEQCGVAERTHFLGFVPNEELSDLYNAADIYISSSHWETFGLATVHASMLGLPVVASAIPASLEVLTIDGATPTIFVEGWNSATWAQAISGALADPHLKERAQAFAPVISEYYSEEKMLSAYRKLFDDLLE